VSKARNSAGNSGHHLAAKNGQRLYTLEVVLAEGPVSEEFLERNPDVSRTIQIRGDQTLQELHEAIVAAFDRDDDQFYSFFLGAGRHRDGKGLLPASTIGSLNLRVGRRLRYHFDPEDDWTHDVKVRAVGDPAAGEKYPKVTARIGESPPQYADGPGKKASPGLPGAAADVSLLIGEMHLKQGEYTKAIEAFTRSIEADPRAADEYEGRARAYRALAAQDERRARDLRAAAHAPTVAAGDAR
jgi:tetratricopeptide (TPR) repeat protein